MTSNRNIDRLEADLGQRDLELELLETLGQELERAERVEQVLKVLVRHALSSAGWDSAVVFLHQEGALVPRSWSSPHGARLENAQLLALGEPLVLECWERQRSVQSSKLSSEDRRLFPGEQSGAAYPLGSLGVLYVGQTGYGGLTVSAGRRLALLARHGARALASAVRLENARAALSEIGTLQQHLEEWSGSLSRFLDGARELAASLEREALLARLERLLRELIPHRSGAVVLGSEVLRAWPAPPEDLSGLVAAFDSRPVPLLLDRAGESRFGALAAGEQSLLVAPIRYTGATLGLIALGAAEECWFTRQEADLLALAGLHLGALLKAQTLYEETVSAYRRLEQSEAQLLQSSKLAAVGQLAAGVAHELNTPLATILLEVESLELDLEELSPGEVRQSLERSGAEVLRARTIVDKLLYYARDARSEGRRPSDVNQVVRDTLALIGGGLRQDGIEIRKELAELPPVVANPNELQQIVINLLLNARDALAGRADAEVRLETRVEEGSAVLRVRDNGPGVPAGLLAEIFDPFFTTKPVGRGTGLGLSISRQIAAAHGGALDLDPDGPGACFRLALPIAEV
ncbi:MAG: hypothetical protein HY319_27585 [Armatimonadetes bacterium]|nr:hypothetical protein [Armatimonadota bacterium]